MVAGLDGCIYFLGSVPPPEPVTPPVPKPEFWRLDPSGAGTWTRLLDPPATLLNPTAHQCVVSVGTPYGVVYIDAAQGRTPKCRMLVYRPA
jgi:hypothetical protein